MNVSLRTIAVLTSSLAAMPAQTVEDELRRAMSSPPQGVETVMQHLWSRTPAPTEDLFEIGANTTASDLIRAAALIALLRGHGGDPNAFELSRLMELATAIVREDHESERLRLIAYWITTITLEPLEVARDLPGKIELQRRSIAASGVRDAEFGLFQHWKKLTLPALRDHLGWQSDAHIDLVVDGNLATDLETIKTKWYAWFVGRAFPTSNTRIPDVEWVKQTVFQDFGPIELHFDDLFTYEEIRKEWDQFDKIVSLLIGKIAPAERDPTPETIEKLLVTLGVVHHAVQDFYCHSNWCHIFTTRVDPKTAKVPTWGQYIADPRAWGNATHILESSRAENISSDRTRGGLQTGLWSRQPPKNTSPWRHVHVEEEEQVALEVAIQATVSWTIRFLNQLPPKHAEALRKAVRSSNR